MGLIDRGAERRALDELLDSARARMSRPLVLRGEPGIDTSASQYAVEGTPDVQVVRTPAVESEQSLG